MCFGLFVFFLMQIYKTTELKENMCAANKKEKYSFVQSNRIKSVLIRIYYEIYNNSQNNAVTSIHMSIIKYILENRKHIKHVIKIEKIIVFYHYVKKCQVVI